MQTPKLKQLWPAFVFFVILVVGISLRTTSLESRDYWYDEAFTGITIRQDVSAMNDIIINDVHPPLYYWLIKGWSLVAGTGPVGLRLFSVLFGVATIVLAFIALREWYPKSWWPAVLGSFVFAINPFLANYSQEARMYTLLGFLLLLAAMLLTKARESHKLGHWIAYAITAAAIIMTHYLGVIFMLGFFLYDAWQQWREDPRKKHWKKHARWFATAYGRALIVGLIWIPFFLNQTSRNSILPWVPNKALHEIPQSLHIFLFGSPVGVINLPPPQGYSVSWLSVAAVTFFLTIGLVTLITWLTLRKRWNKNLRFLGFMAAFPLFVTWILQFVQMPLYVERFLSGSAIFFLLFTIAALWELPKKAWLIGSVAAYFVLVLFIQPWQYKQTFPRLGDIANQEISESEVLFTNAFDFTVGRYYIGEENLDSIKLYNVDDPDMDFYTWILIQDEYLSRELPNESHLIMTHLPQYFPEYHVKETINDHSVLEQ